MTKILIAGGLLLITIIAVVLPRSIAEYNTYKSAQLVVVTVLNLPNCELGYKNKFITIQFDQKYRLRTKCKYIKSLSVGQAIQMFHTPKSDIFLFPQENPLLELAVNFLLGIVGITIILIGFLKHKKISTSEKKKPLE